MADFSFDITAQFDLQELKNALDVSRKEIATRYDLKQGKHELDLKDDELVIATENAFTLSQVWDVLAAKIAKRGLSTRILDPEGKLEDASGGTIRKHYPLRKEIDTENAKKVVKEIKEFFPKIKTQIQGGEVRVSSASKDMLQDVMTHLRGKEVIQIPLAFGNYR